MERVLHEDKQGRFSAVNCQILGNAKTLSKSNDSRNARILEAPACVASRKKSENIDIEEVVNNNVLGK